MNGGDRTHKAQNLYYRGPGSDKFNQNPQAWDDRESGVNTRHILRELLRQELSLGARADGLADGTPLLGALPELDSMAVLAVITAMEERFGLTLDDAEIDGSTFATFGSLLAFIDAHLCV